MIIGVDGTPLMGARTGPGWYLTHLLDALSYLLEEDKAVVWMNNPGLDDRDRIPQNRYIETVVTHFPTAALKMSWNTLGTPALEGLLGRNLDACFYAGFPTPPHKKGAKVIFVHDLAAWTAPEWAANPQSSNFGKELEKHAASCDLILTGSEFNRKEFKRHFPLLDDDKVRVIPHGLSKMFQKPSTAAKAAEVRARYNLTMPYVLFAGTLESRKNLLRLIHGFLIFLQQADPPMELVLAGAKGWIGEEFMQFMLSSALKGKVRWLDAVPQEDLWALYSGAECFAYPALSEGFGMPILEAMGCGAPVIYANSGALPEVAGDAGMAVSPSDVNQWASALLTLQRDEDLRNDMRRKGFARSALFRWDRTAAQTLANIVVAAKRHG